MAKEVVGQLLIHLLVIKEPLIQLAIIILLNLLKLFQDFTKVLVDTNRIGIKL